MTDVEHSLEHRRSVKDRTWDNLLPLLVGILIGALSSFGLFAGRVSALEVRANHTDAQIGDLKMSARDASAKLDRILERLPPEQSQRRIR